MFNVFNVFKKVFSKKMCKYHQKNSSTHNCLAKTISEFLKEFGSICMNFETLQQWHILRVLDIY